MRYLSIVFTFLLLIQYAVADTPAMEAPARIQALQRAWLKAMDAGDPVRTAEALANYKQALFGIKPVAPPVVAPVTAMPAGGNPAATWVLPKSPTASVPLAPTAAAPLPAAPAPVINAAKAAATGGAEIIDHGVTDLVLKSGASTVDDLALKVGASTVDDAALKLAGSLAKKTLMKGVVRGALGLYLVSGPIGWAAFGGEVGAAVITISGAHHADAIDREFSEGLLPMLDDQKKEASRKFYQAAADYEKKYSGEEDCHVEKQIESDDDGPIRGQISLSEGCVVKLIELNDAGGWTYQRQAEIFEADVITAQTEYTNLGILFQNLMYRLRIFQIHQNIALGR